MRNGKRARHLNPTLTRAALITLLVGAGVFGCSSVDQRDGAPTGHVDLSAIPDAVPRVEPRSRYGNPASYKVLGKRYYTLDSSRNYRQRGLASWYGTKFQGRLTSNREPYDLYAMTAAHRTLPLPTYARVTNLGNGRSVVVRINDRGPFHSDRVIDLSYVAAAKLDIVRTGTGRVEVTAIDPAAPQTRSSARKLRPAPPSAPIRPVARKPRPTPPSPPPAAQLYLQIGAFGSLFNAQQLQARIASTVSETVQIHKLKQGPQPLYRVRIGPLESVQLANNLSSELQRDLGLGEMRLVLE